MLGGWCKAEGGWFSPTNDQEFMVNQRDGVIDLVNPIGAVGATIVSYGGKNYVREALENVLAKGKKYAIEVGGFLVERLPGSGQAYDVIRYGAKTISRGSGFEAHHGVMDAWFRGNNFPGYNTNDAPAILLDPADHAIANDVFNDWAIEQFGSTSAVDWATVSQDEIMSLSKNMFDAAGVPQQAQEYYFVTFWHYISNLE